ncbi:Pfs domain protein [Aspergillus affinis]|uniref:Pfs domain protein n=1 Tax=Aspergillus affinis TaxID=1070780 RepID=UPI0022FED0D5|nr:Pfs domain protein [Aspergillus affinis]KAI9043562.1 Pfs domain protein [Aspergillus affinis]
MNIGGVIQYDHGKAVKRGFLQRTGILNKPPQSLLTALNRLEADHLLNESQIPKYLARMAAIPLFAYPGQQEGGEEGEDVLFQAGYEHVHASIACKKSCAREKSIRRPARSSTDPQAHYGLIASSNQVVKNGAIRDRLARELGVLCFEMEAAGLMDQIPCLVIRGISDYAEFAQEGSMAGICGCDDRGLCKGDPCCFAGGSSSTCGSAFSGFKDSI